MASNGPLRTAFDNPLVSTPDVGESTRRGEPATLSNDQPASAAKGLIATPFEKPLLPPPANGDPTPNSSGIPTDWLTEPVKDAPGVGETVGVMEHLATPNTPAGNMTGGKDLSKNIGIGKS